MIEVSLLVLGVAFILVGVFNLERLTSQPGIRISMVIVGVMLIVIVATGCDPNDDCDLETNYGTTQGEVTACSS